MKHIDKIASVSCRVVEIVHWFIGAYLLVIALLMTLAKELVLQAFSNEGEGMILKMMIDNISIDAAQLDATGLYIGIIIMCLLATLMAVLMALIFRSVRLIIKQSFAETPFQSAVIARLRKVAALAIVMPFIDLFGKLLGSLLTNGMLSVDFDLSGFIMGILVLSLVQVFIYGAQLQSDVDGLV